MKKVTLILALALSASFATPMAMADEMKKTGCRTTLPESPNIVHQIITVPFKMVAIFSHIPNCIVHYFPVDPKYRKDK